MITIGRFHTLKVCKKLVRGVRLDGQNLGEILLPEQYVPAETQIGTELDVFIYRDSEDRLIATTEKPYAQVGDIAWLGVADVNQTGAFLDWGLPKDVFVPFSEQQRPLIKGKHVLARIYLDDSQRIAASTKLDSFLYEDGSEFKNGQEVGLIVAEETDLGRKVIVNQSHWGLIYHSDLFKALRKGQKLRGFIKKVRDDKKLEIALNPTGYAKVEGIAGQVLSKLKNEGGFMPVNDKSDPELISKHFGVSKKAFKQAIGRLYKERLLRIEADGIYLE